MRSLVESAVNDQNEARRHSAGRKIGKYGRGFQRQPPPRERKGSREGEGGRHRLEVQIRPHPPKTLWRGKSLEKSNTGHL